MSYSTFNNLSNFTDYWLMISCSYNFTPSVDDKNILYTDNYSPFSIKIGESNTSSSIKWEYNNVAGGGSLNQLDTGFTPDSRIYSLVFGTYFKSNGDISAIIYDIQTNSILYSGSSSGWSTNWSVQSNVRIGRNSSDGIIGLKIFNVSLFTTTELFPLLNDLQYFSNFRNLNRNTFNGFYNENYTFYGDTYFSSILATISNFGATITTESVTILSIGQFLTISSYILPTGVKPPPTTCFLEGSTILCLVNNKEKYIPIEDIRKGMLVKTMNHSYIPVELIGYSIVNNTSDSPILYKCKKENYPELSEDLIITECHAILVDQITQIQREKTLKKFGEIFKTQNKLRLIASIDERAEPWTKPGKYTVWHVALKNENILNNYGIFANGRLLVESVSIRYLKDKSKMTLV